MKLSFTIIAIIIAIMTFSGCSDGGNTPTSNKLNLPNAPFGLNFSEHTNGTNPENGDRETVAHAEKLLDIISPYIEAVKTFTCQPLLNSTESLASLAKKRKLYVAAGCWLAKNLQENIKEINYLLDEIKKGNVDLAVIGSEVLYRNDLTPAQLIAYINTVKASGVPVTFADTANEIENHPEVVAQVDSYMINKYGFWEGNTPEEAYKNFVATVKRLQAKYPGKELIVGETGYPSAGDAFQGAQPSLQNMLYYAEKVLMYCKLHNIRIFYFSAFDEPWKPRAVPVGPNWGLWTKDLVMKQGVLDVLKKTPVPDAGSDPIVSIVANENCTETNSDFFKTIKVSLNAVSTKDVTVEYTTADNTAVSSTDYVAASGTLTITAGSTSANISVKIIGDTVYEPDEAFVILMTGPTNATLGNSTSTVIIKNDDPAPVVLPAISISNLSVSEDYQNSTINLSVTLDKPSNANVTVQYATAGITAVATDDYLSASGSLTFTPGQTSKNIAITTVGDLLNESDETFKVVLSSPSGATLAKEEGIVMLINDDQPLNIVVDTPYPKIGETTNLTGRCYGLNPADYKVAVYIKVGNGWWIKPYFNTPTTPIGLDGKWSCDITTGGNDTSATQIAVFLIPSTFTPIGAGGGALPQETINNATKALPIIDRTIL